MLKESDDGLISPFDSEAVHDSYELNEAHGQSEEIQYKQWLMQKAIEIANRASS